jgi:hypothetical protein
MSDMPQLNLTPEEAAWLKKARGAMELWPGGESFPCETETDDELAWAVIHKIKAMEV